MAWVSSKYVTTMKYDEKCQHNKRDESKLVVAKTESIIINALWSALFPRKMELHRDTTHGWRAKSYFFVILCFAPSIRSQNTFAAASRDRRGTSREKRTCKRDQGAGKPEKFIKRFLSWHRRTSVSDLLAPASDPACPQEDSPGVRLVEGSRWLCTSEFKAPSERRRRISPSFC